MPDFIFIQQISVLNILNMLYNLHFFSSKCRSFHNATLFGFCITHILNTGCAKIWEKKSVAKRLMWHLSEKSSGYEAKQTKTISASEVMQTSLTNLDMIYPKRR